MATSKNLFCSFNWTVNSGEFELHVEISPRYRPQLGASWQPGPWLPPQLCAGPQTARRHVPIDPFASSKPGYRFQCLRSLLLQLFTLALQQTPVLAKKLSRNANLPLCPELSGLSRLWKFPELPQDAQSDHQ